ncbi:MAG: large-conductance mechanosensitive channel protein MscL [Planctomycetota bacterium]|nr:large-conductance mechanosensitive channel protein MscL [Planctomycetota bacterium]
MLAEFKKFAMRGNVMDMAIGIILGAAFGKIVSSFVKGLVMPPLGLLIGGMNFDALRVVLKDGEGAVMDGDRVITPAIEEVAVEYGAFLTTVIDFLIVAFVIFMVVRTLNKLKRAEPAPEATEKTCSFCCSTIALAATRCPQCTADLGAAKA